MHGALLRARHRRRCPQTLPVVADWAVGSQQKRRVSNDVNSKRAEESRDAVQGQGRGGGLYCMPRPAKNEHPPSCCAASACAGPGGNRRHRKRPRFPQHGCSPSPAGLGNFSIGRPYPFWVRRLFGAACICWLYENPSPREEAFIDFPSGCK